MISIYANVDRILFNYSKETANDIEKFRITTFSFLFLLFMSLTLLKKLKTLAKDTTTVPLSRIPADVEKICFIVCNTYTSYRLSLGDGPLNDAITFATSMKSYGFTQYFMHNPHSRNFLSYLDAFFKNTLKHLVVYYVGHGTTVADLNKDEDDGYDEAFVFEDGTIIDDILLEHLIKNKNETSRLTLITDACHSGSIWDIQSKVVNGNAVPQMVMSISAANDKQTAKQAVIDRKEQGIFTMNLGTTLKKKPAITPKDLLTELRTPLKKYSQTCTVAYSSKELETKTIFND
ncbi:Clan CD, family C14, metacaspase-like cysteine peptidase [Tritrichomonas foetus]|uniref:Clan CD, family C14, metacaspase-like cysteine peptidase n=1 Tax=Tritrichomonas foetus TaxID=1144522 RepID=A0A1J4JAH5_9EUKA|nr:Clan CD, family C14, metacaspase-like cysteine peptidase [Tritrichomonas foetus]|eukprot:OHS94651.1 Clan CD, family C14, metacaspase-like cysteine peptidase [Tritrichomonas foetus]